MEPNSERKNQKQWFKLDKKTKKDNRNRGGRLENCHLREIRREAKREENKTEIDELDNEEDELEEKQNNLSEDEFSTEKAEKELKIKYAYNDTEN